MNKNDEVSGHDPLIGLAKSALLGGLRSSQFQHSLQMIITAVDDQIGQEGKQRDLDDLDPVILIITLQTIRSICKMTLGQTPPTLSRQDSNTE